MLYVQTSTNNFRRLVCIGGRTKNLFIQYFVALFSTYIGNSQPALFTTGLESQ